MKREAEEDWGQLATSYSDGLQRAAQALKDLTITTSLAIGRIFKAITSPVGTPLLWALNNGYHEDRTPTHGYEATRVAAPLSRRVGGGPELLT